MVDILALERPGEVVGDEDGVKTCCEGWIDIGLGTVSDHPCGASLAAVMRGETAVSHIMFFGQNLDGAEVASQTGTAKLVSLFAVISLGDEDETVTRAEFGQSFEDVGKKLDLLVGDRLGEADDAVVFFRRNGAIGKLLETGNERLTEAGQSIATSRDGGPFHGVEPLANLLGVVDTMIEIGDERSDGPLKVDVVLPERVVCVDEQRLIRGVAGRMSFADHRG